MRVILASTSPARLMLLTHAGITPTTIAPPVDEDALAAAAAARGTELTPPALVLLLAKAKAKAVADQISDPNFDGLVIGGDSVFAFRGSTYGKPLTADAATERWRQMRGKSGILHSGHCVIRIAPGMQRQTASGVAHAVVSFAGDISDDEIAAYVATEEPLWVAGAFTVDAKGGAFIERIEGDPSTVVGMSLSMLRDLVGGFGLRWTDLWDSPPAP